jgi:hypothetical protein
MPVGVVTETGSNTVFLSRIGDNIHTDSPKAFVGAGSRIISHHIRTGQIFTNQGECLSLFLPGLRPKQLPSRARGEALEDVGCHLILLRLADQDDVDAYFFVLCDCHEIVRVPDAGLAGLIRN